ncbi:hypothetical protein [Acetilactobacillus jinshanensis]|uniref:Streptococcal hemagglutinin protein n=1 Tax=Acetilactobacillus jinshanensis TaxID=1720083 RepID=A0A4P6ZKL0_9LACO|nr:hypothetical protein [Acetilactobacillus jinshanensis]QBP17790.1 hypothetical protein ELX58_01080 [Acetilactobacillus jinshanensis]URL60653.1 hypothetical protein HGK75_01110 [uncultured bacterium]
MLPNESQHSQLKCYRFNYHRQKRNNQQAVICVWISGLIIIVFLILGGIRLFNQHQTAENSYHSHVTRHVSKSDQSVNRNSLRAIRTARNDRVEQERQPKVNYNTTVQKKRQPPIPPQPVYHKQRFASISNAKAWAQATQQRWLHAGYTNYLVRSDGQGDYYLQFTKSK